MWGWVHACVHIPEVQMAPWGSFSKSFTLVFEAGYFPAMEITK